MSVQLAQNVGVRRARLHHGDLGDVLVSCGAQGMGAADGAETPAFSFIRRRRRFALRNDRSPVVNELRVEVAPDLKGGHGPQGFRASGVVTDL